MNLVPDLIRISPDAARMMPPAMVASVQGVRPGDERSHHGARIDSYSASSRHSRFQEEEIEVLGLGGRGRPVISLPSSAFFAQHISQNPEPEMDGSRQARTADGAYRNAADLGVTMMSPDPISVAI